MTERALPRNAFANGIIVLLGTTGGHVGCRLMSLAARRGLADFEAFPMPLTHIDFAPPYANGEGGADTSAGARLALPPGTTLPARIPDTETLEQLTSHGDHLLRERVIPLEEVRDQNQRYNSWIKKRAAELAHRHPEHTDALQAYVEKELDECRILETDVTCATWMLRRSG